MTKTLVLSILLILVSCASTPKTSVFDLAKNSQYSVIKKTEAISVEEANKVLQSRFNYLTLLFEQSRDPYYGQPKWTETCLKGNKIGAISKEGSDLIFVSELYVDGKGNPGFCPENPFALKAYEVYFYCEKEHQVYQITLPTEQTFDLKKVSLCH